MSFSMSPFPLRFGSRQGDSAPPAPIYEDDFSADTSSEWSLHINAVDGVISVSGGNLVYTRGAGDGAEARIRRPITGLTVGRFYRIDTNFGGTGSSQRLRWNTNTLVTTTGPITAYTQAAAETADLVIGVQGTAGQTITAAFFSIYEVDESEVP